MSTRNIGLRERRASHSRSAWIASTTGFVRSLLTSNRDCGGLGNLACLLTFVTFRSKTQDKNKTYVLKCCRGKDEHKLFAGRVRGMNECVPRHVVEERARSSKWIGDGMTFMLLSTWDGIGSVVKLVKPLVSNGGLAGSRVRVLYESCS